MIGNRMVRLLLLVMMVGLMLGTAAPAKADAPDYRYFSATGHFVSGDFLHFFDTRGGLDIFGYPRTEAFIENGRVVQYFQRAKLELWPENPAPWRVQLALLGTLIYGPGDPPISNPNPGGALDYNGVRYYPETGHTLYGAFRTFYNTRGGLDIFGYPTTEPFMYGGFLVQMFQRYRLEYHPELGDPYTVSLGLLGDTAIFARSFVDVSMTLPVPATQVPVSPTAKSDLGGHIAFQVESGGPIYYGKTDGSDLKVVGYGLDPALSPSGNEIAYTVWDAGQGWGLWVMNVDGSNAHRIRDDQRAQGPQWSPDGSKITYYHYSQVEIPTRRGMRLDDRWGVRVANVADGSYIDIKDDTRSQAPTFTPDGLQIIYRGLQSLMLVGSQATGPADNSKVPVEMRQPVQIASTDPRYSSVSVSPDGKQIAYQFLMNDHYDIGVMNIDGSGQHLLTEPQGYSTVVSNSVSPVWSPDGKYIAFATDREKDADGSYRIYVMNADGSNPHRMVDTKVRYNNAAERVISWSH